MKTSEMIQMAVIGLALVGGIAAVISNAAGPSKEITQVDVDVPELSQEAKRGSKIYDTNCVQCHGKNSSGTELGPPLVHNIYNPGHHNDDSFFRAVQKGVTQHHWPYGNMPPQPQVSKSDASNIIAYVRELQRANGIFYQKHQM